MKQFWNKVTIEGVVVGAVAALLLGAWAWHKFIS